MVTAAALGGIRITGARGGSGGARPRERRGEERKEKIETKKKILETTGRKVYTLSVIDDASLKDFKDMLTRLVKQHK